MSVNKDTKALEVKHITQTAAKPATCEQHGSCTKQSDMLTKFRIKLFQASVG